MIIKSSFGKQSSFIALLVRKEFIGDAWKCLLAYAHLLQALMKITLTFPQGVYPGLGPGQVIQRTEHLQQQLKF